MSSLRQQLDEALKKSEEKLSTIFWENPLCVAVISIKDHDHHYLEVNEQFERITGWKRDEVIGRNPSDMGIFVDSGQRNELVTRLLSGEAVRNVATQLRTKNGEIRTVLGSAELIEIEGEPCILSMDADITHLKRAEEIRLRHQLILEFSDDAIISKNLEGVIQSWNRGAQRLLGYTEEEAVGRPITIIVPDELRDEETDILQKLRNGEHVEHYETVRITKNGKRINVSVSISTMRDSRGMIIGACTIARDITERKRFENSLLWRLNFERLVSDLSRTFIVLHENEIDTNIEKGLGCVGEFLKMDRITLYEFSSDRAAMGATYSWSGAGVKQPSRLVATDAVPWWWDRAVRGEATFMSELNDLPADACLEKEFMRQRGVVSAASIPLRAAGETNGVIIFATVQRQVLWTEDLTNQLRIIGDIFWNALQRKHAMAALLNAQAIVRESEERLRLSMESGRSVGWERNVKSGQASMFGDLPSIFGIPSDAYVGQAEDFHRYLHPEDRQRVLAAIDSAMKTRNAYAAEFRLLWPDGTVHWLAARGKFYYSPEGEPTRMLGVATDISDRKAAEEALRESEERFRLAIQAGRMYAFDWNVVTDEIVRSEESKHIFGLTAEPSRLTKRELLALVHPEDRALFINSLSACTPENPKTQITYRLLRPDGSVLWLERTGRAFFDEQGRMVRMNGMVIDVTDRKRTEEALRQREVELSQAQRLAQVGSWHWDVNNDVVTWSEELYRIAGRDPSLRAPSCKEHPQILTPDSWSRLNAAVKTALRSGDSYELDLEVVRPDGTTRWIAVRGEAIRNAEGLVVALRGTVQDVTERKWAEEALSTVSQKLIEAHEEERTRIARDLHDDINQRLALLAAQVDELKPEEARKQIEDLASDIQALSHRLHSSKLEYLGLAAAAAAFCRELSDRNGVKIDFHAENVSKELPRETSLGLFRVLQEALQNAIKHSGSQHLQVSLKADANEIELTVHDSGIGFDPQEAMKGRGLGLTSMQERLKLVHGKLSIDSQLRRGTTIRACVPLKSKERSTNAVG